MLEQVRYDERLKRRNRLERSRKKARRRANQQRSKNRRYRSPSDIQTETDQLFFDRGAGLYFKKQTPTCNCTSKGRSGAPRREGRGICHYYVNIPRRFQERLSMRYLKYLIKSGYSEFSDLVSLTSKPKYLISGGYTYRSRPVSFSMSPVSELFNIEV